MAHKVMAVSLKKENIEKIIKYVETHTDIRSKSHLIDIALDEKFKREEQKEKRKSKDETKK